MTINAAHWTIERDTKKIAYIGNDHGVGSETYATVIEFHRWLQSLADDAVAVGDDELDITNTDPSRRSTDNIITLINGYTLEESTGTPASEHLFDGSIIQDDGDTIWDGIVNFGNADVVIQVMQDGAVLSDDWWNLTGSVGANADANSGISHRWMIKTRSDGVDIDGRRLIGTTRVLDDTDQKTFGEFKINGTSRGNNVFALTNSDDLNNDNTATIIGGWATFSNTEGLNLIDINDDGSTEEYYSKWANSGAIDQNAFYERAKWIVRDGSSETIHGINGELFRGITHNFAFSGTGIDPATNDKLVWGTLIVMTAVARTFTIGEAVHEDSATPTWKGRVLAQDDTNNRIIVDIESGTVSNADTFTGQTSSEAGTVSGAVTAVTGGGEFVCLAVDDDGATGNLYIQILKGTAPPNAGIIYDDVDLTSTLTLTSAPTGRAVATPFIGASTGSNIIGAYGIGFDTVDINDSDVLTALDGFTYSRPNLVTNTVGGLNITGDKDYVIVAPWDGVSTDSNGDPAIDKDQLSLSGPISDDNRTTIVVQEAIPTDTPSSGYIRVTDDNGVERKLHYTEWDTSTFTIDTTDGNEDFVTVNAANGNDVYITYLDQEATSTSHSYQGTYDTARDLVVVVRNGGTAPIKQFIAEWSFGSTGATLNAIRTTDT